MCDNGKKVERACSPGLHFNPKLEVCDWPDVAGCSLVNDDENINSEESNIGENNDPDNNGNGENDSS